MLYYDLHIHSALSPCAEDDMTPNNIVHMAMLKELSLIAVTDHNSCENLPAVKKVADECGILLLPGLEITTVEDVHLLAYFPCVDTALAFSRIIYEGLPDMGGKALFGRQIIYDENDEETGELTKLLINACPYSLSELAQMIRERGGVPVPAHINRPSSSLLAMLGFIPRHDKYETVEVYGDEMVPEAERLLVIRSSDAHDLMSINEKLNFLGCEPTVAAVLQALRRGMSI